MNVTNHSAPDVCESSDPSEAKWKPWAFGMAGMTAGLLVAAGVWLGRIPGPNATPAPMDAQAVAEQMMLNAGSASANDAFAVCTGPVDDSEGLFMLDFLTGELTCVVIHPRTGKFLARFSTNVVANFPTDATKKARYLLTSGDVDFRGGGAANRLGRSVVYVVDANTGNFAAFGIPWNPNLWNNAQPMLLQLQMIDAGRARNIAVGE